MDGANRASRFAPHPNLDYRRLWLSIIVSGLGDWSARVALSVLVYQRTGSALSSALVVAVAIVPWMGPGQWLVHTLRHRSHRSVMIASDVARAFVWAIASLGRGTVALIALALVAELLTVPFASRRSLAIRTVVAQSELPAAVAMANATFQGSVVVGYLLGAATIAAAPNAALQLNAVSFLVSASLLRRLPTAEASGTPPARSAPSASVWQDRSIRLLTIANTASVLAAMGLETLVVPFVLTVRQGAASWPAVVVALVPVVTIGVSFASTHWSSPVANLRRATMLALSIAGGATGILLVDHGLFGAVGLAATAGAAFAVTTAVAAVVLERLPLDASAARQFAVFQGTVNVGQATGALGVGLLADRRGAVPTATLGAAVTVALIVALAAVARRLGDGGHRERHAGFER